MQIWNRFSDGISAPLKCEQYDNWSSEWEIPIALTRDAAKWKKDSIKYISLQSSPNVPTDVI
jgi:hypothetical protein